MSDEQAARVWDQKHAKVGFVISLVGVDEGIPDFDKLRALAEELGYEFWMFEVVDPEEQQGPALAQDALKVMREFREKLLEGIDEVQSFVGDMAADEVDDMLGGVYWSIHEGWDDLEKALTEERATIKRQAEDDG